MRKLSQDKINSIHLLLFQGASVKSVARHVKVSKSTVSKYKDLGGFTGRISKGGRKRTLTETAMRQIKRDVLSGRLKTAVEVRRDLVRAGYDVSHATVIRTLKALGFEAKLKKKKPLISAKNRKARLKWAEEHKHWTEKDWERVVFTDETKINIWGSDGVRYCWVQPGDPLKPHHLDLTVKHGGGSLMMWGCMTAKGVGYACHVEESIDSRVYCEVLESTLKDSLDYYGLDVDDITFQHDNAACHSSNTTTKWLKDQGFDVLPWPAQSPDLNPIEHIWHYLKVRLSTYERKATSIRELWERVDKEWNSIRSDLCAKFIRSMKDRIDAVIAAKGGPTRY